MRHHGVSRLRGRHVRRWGVTDSVAKRFHRTSKNVGARSETLERRWPWTHTSMNTSFGTVSQVAAVDQRLTSWRWFQRNAHQSQTSTWRVQVGQTLIRLGCWLQGDRLCGQDIKEA